MPLDGSADDIETDFEILEAIGRRHEDVSEGLARSGAPLRTLRRWLIGHVELPDDPDERACLTAMALDLELFTPSPSGRTPMGRYLQATRAQDAVDVQALEALRGARWRLVEVVERDGPDDVLLIDLVGGERLRLLDARISPLAAGAAAVMRLCPLASGRQVLISPLFALVDEDLAVAKGFVRPGKGLGDGYRCAAVLYRDMARKGFAPMPQLDEAVDGDDQILEFSEVEVLALRWFHGLPADPDAELVADIRRAASVSNLVEACDRSARRAARANGFAAAFEGVARIQMETIAGRASAGVGGFGEALAEARKAIAGHVAAGAMDPQARELFERLATLFARPGAASGASGSREESELARVLNLVQALRARTVERGCSEAEAMAAAAKLAELLDRYDLSLDEVSVRQSECEGVTVSTGRRRRAPADACVQPIADFCDCRVWAEEDEHGAFRYVFFGLRADVQGARLLHDLVEAAFESETAAFRSGATYLSLRGGDRRMAANSFQVGLANGVAGKLEALRRERTAGGAKAGGFDLVAVKRTVVDEELERLGLAFTTRTSRKGRLVHEEAYLAGRAAGALFEPRAALEA